MSFVGEERIEYEKYENKALKFYVNFRRRHAKSLSKHFLRLKAKLTQVRIACAGGRVPLDDHNATETEEHEEAHPEEELGSGNKKKAKSVQFSDFAFKSKVARLISELKDARDKEPACK